MVPVAENLKECIAYQSPEAVPKFRELPSDIRLAITTASTILPFKTNTYITDELIDWERIPNDPIFQLNFPQEEDDFANVRELILNGDPLIKIRSAINKARMHLMPKEIDTVAISLPTINSEPVLGLCHQFRETMLTFPSSAANCFAICTYCYRWMKHVESDTFFE